MSVIVLSTLHVLPYLITGVVFLRALRVFLNYFTALIAVGLKTTVKCLCFLPMRRVSSLNFSLI